jgi:hypothetical protein
MHQRKYWKCSACGVEIPNLPMPVLQHQISHGGRAIGWSLLRRQGRAMKPSDMMPIDHDKAQMWQLNADRRSMRMQFGLPIQGTPEPLLVKIDFDAGMIDQMIERLLVLRAQMLPALPKPGKRN